MAGGWSWPKERWGEEPLSPEPIFPWWSREEKPEEDIAAEPVFSSRVFTLINAVFYVVILITSDSPISILFAFFTVSGIVKEGYRKWEKEKNTL